MLRWMQAGTYARQRRRSSRGKFSIEFTQGGHSGNVWRPMCELRQRVRAEPINQKEDLDAP